MMFSIAMKRSLSISKCSQEDYHGGTSASVPFTWESRPGTPRINCRENPLPPLTPPPSYYSNLPAPSERLVVVRKKSINLFRAMFPKRSSRKKQSPSSSSSSSSSSFSFASSPRPRACSVPSSPMVYPRSRAKEETRSRRFSFGWKVDDVEDEEEEEDDELLRKRSVMCFGNH